MPHFRFNFYSPIFYCLIVAGTMLPSITHGAEWRDCEKAKLRELKLQQGSRESKPTKSKKKNQRSRGERIEEIETWLWKNCREFSYELRQLEQDRM